MKSNHIKKDTFFYIVSAGLNKGYLLIIFPTLTSFMSLSDFAIWNLVTILSFMLAPILSLNGSAGILRLGTLDKSSSLPLLMQFILISIIISILSISICFIFSLQDWITFSVLYGLFEAIFLLISTFIRTLEKAKYYFLFSCFKFLIILFTTLYAYLNQLDIYRLLILQIIILFSLIFIITLFILYKFKSNYTNNDYIRTIIIFCILLIPHGLAQWILTSADRITIERIMGMESVGIYSLAYNIAMVLVLLNTVLSLVIPPYFIKNYEVWKDKQYDALIMKYYTFLSIGIYIFIVFMYILDKNIFHLLGYYQKELPILITIIYLSIYFLGLYYFYANYLFYHKQGRLLSIISLKAAFINIMLTILTTYFIGLYGAALSTLITYIYYVVTIRKDMLRFEPNVDIPLKYNINIFVIAILTVFIIWSTIYE